MPQPSAFLLPQNPVVNVGANNQIEIIKPSTPNFFFTKLTAQVWFGKNESDYRLRITVPKGGDNLLNVNKQLNLKKGDTVRFVFREDNNLYQLTLVYLNTIKSIKNQLEYSFDIVGEPDIQVYNSQAKPQELCQGGCILIDQGYIQRI
jgi:hypothetical protein